ncbi:type IV secretion system DNA-binding domain-containing protein, partial [Acidithiobacillus ferrivorans]|nr:type IV secretion system DNA-binding domain-containing protein [Acidithiobacillus ferrivorans]
ARTAGIFPHIYAAPLAAGAALGLTAGLFLGWKLGDIPAEIHIRGRKLTYSAREAAQALRPPRSFFRKSQPAGVKIHPEISITEQQECRHILLLGGSGSGKTSVLWPVITQAQARGDRCLIFSFKGDFQQKATFPFSLLAPWDSRSVRWQLGKDIRTRLHAESLAKTLIPTPEKDPIWAQGAQGLLTAIISEVQSKYRESWGFFRLAQACSIALSDYDSLVQTVMSESPLARSFLMGKDSKTTASYLAQMASNLSDVVNLGVADYSNRGSPWSIRDWLSGRTPNAAILGYLSESEELSGAYCASIIEQVVKQVLSFPDVSPDQRRIWLFLDEVPQAGKIPSITSALEAARSKGCRVVLGMQGVAQLEEHGYSKNTLDIWSGQCGIKIIANLSTPRDQKWAADLLGERELERYQSNLSTPSGDGNSQQSGGYQRTKEHVLLPASFGTELHVDERKNGGQTALIVTSKVAAVIKWPFPALQAQRPAHTEAAWITPGFVRPVWGKTPPMVAIPAHIPASDSAQAGKPGDQKAALSQEIVQPHTPENPEATATAGDGAGTMIADQVIDSMLDAVIPGAGMLHSMMSMFSGSGGGDAGATVMLKKPVQLVAESERDTHESDGDGDDDEDEAGN